MRTIGRGSRRLRRGTFKYQVLHCYTSIDAEARAARRHIVVRLNLTKQRAAHLHSIVERRNITRSSDHHQIIIINRQLGGY